MRVLGIALLLALLAPACGGGGSGDLSTVASAIRDAELRGAEFQLTETLSQSGGEIPKGKIALVKFTARGRARDDNAEMVLKLKNSTGASLGSFDLIIGDSDLFVRPHGSTREWFEGPAGVANHFYPGVRLNLLRETVLLASKVTRGATFSNGALLNQYTITPGGDQLEQVQSTVVGPQEEAKYLKSAVGTMTVFLTGGGQLKRVDLKASGTDPTTSLKQTIDSSLVFNKIGGVSAVAVPATAIQVQPGNLFATTRPSA